MSGFPLCKARMKVEFSLVKRERPVYVFDFGSRARILIRNRLTEKAVNNQCYCDKKSYCNSVLCKFSPRLVMEKAFDVFHRLFLRLGFT